PRCWAPWVAAKEKVGEGAAGHPRGPKYTEYPRKDSGGREGLRRKSYNIVSYTPSCQCEKNDGSVRGTVLEPFCGSGTTGLVAEKHGRLWIGIELNPDYIEIAKRRLAEGK